MPPESPVPALIQEYVKYSIWAGWATLAVAFGVLIEFLSDIPEIFHRLSPYKKTAKLIGIVIGAPIVFIGIYAEYHYNDRATDFLNRLEEMSQSQFDEVGTQLEGRKTFGPQVLKPRRLSEDLINRMSTELKQFSGQEYEIVTYPEHSECTYLASDISIALSNAHWKDVTLKGEELKLVMSEVRIYTSPDADKNTKNASLQLFFFLREIGAGLMPDVDKTIVSKNKIVIKIGLLN